MSVGHRKRRDCISDWTQKEQQYVFLCNSQDCELLQSLFKIKNLILEPKHRTLKVARRCHVFHFDSIPINHQYINFHTWVQTKENHSGKHTGLNSLLSPQKKTKGGNIYCCLQGFVRMTYTMSLKKINQQLLWSLSFLKSYVITKLIIFRFWTVCWTKKVIWRYLKV